MRKRNLLAFLLMLFFTMTASAQRFQDRLDRGVLAIKVSGGVYVNWRIQADEYYDVKYNLYRNGSKIAENLEVSNYTDASGAASSTYAVAAVVNGKEQTRSAAVGVWQNNFMEITPKHPSSLTATYIPNDACCADVDGDGVVEILMKYTNQQESGNGFPKEGYNGEYTLFECLKLDGTVLWWVNCGPNMGDFQNNEQNIVGYDWDQDGKAEVIMRLNEGASVHMADGSVYAIGADGKNGTSWTNKRQPKTGGVEWFTFYGNEFLFYCEGATGKPYQVIPFPCARLEPGETDLNAAWGDGYGHRSNKFFYGAPYLDGRNPSIFIGRGIYTRHKFVALDVDKNTHQLTERWRWTNNQKGSPWYGQGYHNYAIVDVDWDGRDEIVWGSMVIDDNGKGLSTTGLGHGDAQHHGDLNPYKWGQEGFFCNEDKPANNYRDLTTSKLYHRYAASGDDGRAIAGNFNGQVPGAMGFSAHENAVSCVTGNVESSLVKTGVGMNFRCYWDGDLQEETYNGGDNTVGSIYKYGRSGALTTLTGSLTNNSTKATPCFMGDIMGDWREEFVVRTPDNKVRIYSTTIPTQWRNYSLWYDHQYRNGMVWEPCGYNQPPHVSYFLGELEGITAAPPSLTMQGRIEVSNGSPIGPSYNDKQIITCETNDMTVNVSDGATPYIYIDNAPSWIQGSAPSECTTQNTNINYTYYTHTVTGGAFSGNMRLVKQGDGTLVLPNVVEKYTGKTEVWAGKLLFDGTMQSSPVWLNRHTTLVSKGGQFLGGLEADYNATINVGGNDVKSDITVSTLTLNMGAKVMLDIYCEDATADVVNMKKLVINHHKEWGELGPELLTPVIDINAHLAAGESSIRAGKYLIGTVEAVEGELADIKLGGLKGAKGVLLIEDGKLYLDVAGMRDPAEVVWTGAGTDWDLATAENFSNNGSADIFVTNDDVTFNDDAVNTTVNLKGELSPSVVRVNNFSKKYTLQGTGSIVAGEFVKTGSGEVVVANDNTYTGGNSITGGTVTVSKLANSIDPVGNLGGLTTVPSKFVISNGAVLHNTAAVTNGAPMTVTGDTAPTTDEEGNMIPGNKYGVIDCGAKFTQQATISGDTLVKTGSGELFIEKGSLSNRYIIVKEGTFNSAVAYSSKVLRLEGRAAAAGAGLTGAAINVAKGANATLTLTGNNYAAYTGALTGEGVITINPTNTVNRVRMTGSWANFKGTVKVTNTTITFPLDNSNGPANGTIDLAEGTRMANVAKTFTIGKLTGKGTLMQPYNNFQSSAAVSGSNTWRVGNSWEGLSSDFTFDGFIADEGGTNKSNFEKIGTCKMTVSQPWNMSGTVKVSGGELHLNAKATPGTGALTVNAGAALTATSGNLALTAKNSPLTNSSYTINGTLMAGTGLEASTVAFLYFNDKTLTFGATGELRFSAIKNATSSNPGCTTLRGDGSKSTIIFKDGARVTPYVVSTYKPTATADTPDKFEVFSNFPNVTVGNVVFNLPSLKALATNNAYYTWDTSDFSKGVIYVRHNNLVKGDADGDGVVTMSDANLTVNYYLGETQDIIIPAADIDGDGIITMADANAIVNMYLGQ